MRKKLVVAALLLAACSGEKEYVKPTKADQPEWIMKGQGAFPGEKNKVYAVGEAAGIRNPSLLRQTADNRALAALTKVFKAKMEAMTEDYMASTTDFQQGSAEEQNVRAGLRVLLDSTLSGAMIVDRFVDDQGTMYSLAVLDLGAFSDLADRQKQLDDRTKAYIRANAAKTFSDMDAALEKNRE